MRHILLIIGFILIVGQAQAADRIAVQVQFKKGIFECPGGKEVVDWNVGGGKKYEHVCTDGTWLNSFKEYNGTVKVSPEDYEKMTAEELAARKQALVDEWIYEIEHPAPYVSPTVDDYKSMLDNSLAEVARVSAEMEKIATKEQMAELSEKVTATALVIKPVETVEAIKVVK